MKLVLYRGDDEIVEIIEDCGEVRFNQEEQKLVYRDGEIRGLQCDYAVLEDEAPVDAGTLLLYRKKQKIDELEKACEETILSGFYCPDTGHWYGFNQFDQMNLTQQYVRLMADPNLTGPIDWKTEDSGVVSHTREEFFAVVDAAEQHKRGNIQQYWELKAQVEAATTRAEVDAITWTPWSPSTE